MTTTINDISDLARILEERPEWAETLRSLLLAREVLDLPERLDQFILEMREFTRETREQNQLLVQQMEQTRQRMDGFDQTILEIREFTRETREQNQLLVQRMDGFDQTILEIREQNRLLVQRMDEFDQTILEIREQNRLLVQRMDEFDQTILEIRGFVQETREHNQRVDQQMEQTRQRMDGFDQTILEIREQNRLLVQRMDEFEQTILEIREFVQETREQNQRMDGFERRMDRAEDLLGRLLGGELESRLSGSLIPILAARFNLRRPFIMKSRFFQPEPALYDLLDAAEEAGHISVRQSSQLQLADFILRAQRKDTGSPVYMVVEASRTVNEKDITRSRERADILAAATGIETLAVVVGNFVPEPQERQAADWGVTIIAVAEPEDE